MSYKTAFALKIRKSNVSELGHYCVNPLNLKSANWLSAYKRGIVQALVSFALQSPTSKLVMSLRTTTNERCPISFEVFKQNDA